MKTHSFNDFNLREELLHALARKGFSEPMPVQVAVLSDEQAIEGDMIVQAETGSGKTLAFALPLLNSIDLDVAHPQILVLSPTRELALQTAREFAWLGAEMRVRVATLVGGMDMERQIRSLREGAPVVVGTPGRVLDHIRRGTLTTSSISSLVLDEGDHMLDMGFHDELEAILEALHHISRTWLFSATMPESVVGLARSYLDAPKRISLVKDAMRHESIRQKAYIIPSRRRFEGLCNVLLWEQPKRALLFCATRVETSELADRLNDEGFNACALHGEMTQRERNSALEALRNGRVSILVATDVAARGLDINGLSHVIQYGLPGNLDAFVHRSGRTGRAGHEGADILLLTARESRQFRSMIRGSSVEMEWLPAPDLAEIEGLMKSRFETSILDAAAGADEYEEWAEQILQRDDLLEIVTGLLAKAYGDQPSGYSIRADVEQEMAREKGRKDPHFETRRLPDRSRSSFSVGGRVVKFSAGRQDGWEVGSVLGALCRGLGIKREDVGNIRLRNDEVHVELSEHALEAMEKRRTRLEGEGLIPAFENASSNRSRSSKARASRPRK